MHETGHAKSVHWDNPEGWDREESGRGVWNGAPVFIAALFTIAWTWKQPRSPLADEWIRKFVEHIHSGILLSYIKECI